MKHCWKKVETVQSPRWDERKRKKVGLYRYVCSQCGSEFVTENAGKLTSKDWKNPAVVPFDVKVNIILDDCAMQTVNNVTNA